MSSEPGPGLFLDDCSVQHIPVDNEDAALFQLRNVYVGPMERQWSADNGGLETCIGAQNTVEPVQETNQSVGAGIGGGIEVTKPVSCPDVDHDSESVTEPEGRALHNDTVHPTNPLEGNRVRKRSPTITARSTTGHASQASDQLPISSSENAEEQGGDAERDEPRKSKSSSGRKPSKRRKK